MAGHSNGVQCPACCQGPYLLIYGAPSPGKYENNTGVFLTDQTAVKKPVWPRLWLEDQRSREHSPLPALPQKSLLHSLDGVSSRSRTVWLQRGRQLCLRINVNTRAVRSTTASAPHPHFAADSLGPTTVQTGWRVHMTMRKKDAKNTNSRHSVAPPLNRPAHMHA